MIKITLLSGPYAGEVREIPAEFGPQETIGPIDNHGWDWWVDYSQASEKEKLAWGRIDLAVRSVRALQRGRVVFFLGREYRGVEAVGVLEDAIVASGRMVTIGFDDERGLLIQAPAVEEGN